MRRASVFFTSLLAAGLLSACSGTTEATSTGITATPCAGAIGVMLPYTGTSQLDTVQMNWARVSLDNFNRVHGTSFSIVPQNVDHDAAVAAAGAETLAQNKKVVGVVGPSTSVAVAAAGPVLGAAGLAYVSPSATRAALTDGSLSGFYRVVANDSIQGPTVADFVASSLHPNNVLVVSDPEAYSQALTDSITSSLTSQGVKVSKITIPLDRPDPNAVLQAITSNTNVVVLALLQPTDGQTIANSIAVHGLHPAILATDSMFDLNTFDVPGAYVSTFAPDLSTVAGGNNLVRLYKEIFGDLAPYGGPSYVAMQVVLTAALDSCKGGVATRAGVSSTIGNIHLENTILGQSVAFDAHGDVKNGKFYIYRIEGGNFVPQN